MVRARAWAPVMACHHWLYLSYFLHFFSPRLSSLTLDELIFLPILQIPYSFHVPIITPVFYLDLSLDNAFFLCAWCGADGAALLFFSFTCVQYVDTSSGMRCTSSSVVVRSCGVGCVGARNNCKIYSPLSQYFRVRGLGGGVGASSLFCVVFVHLVLPVMVANRPVNVIVIADHTT